MEDFGKEILEFPLALLKLCGQNPTQNKAIFFTSTILHSIYASTLLGFVVLQFFYETENHLIVIVQTCEAFVTYSQGMCKSLTVASKIKKFYQLILDTEKFWKSNRFDSHTQKELENIFKHTLQVEKIFLRAMFVAGFVVMANVYFTKELPAGPWTMKDHDELFKYVLIGHELFLPYITIFLMAYDCFFLSMCVHLTVQFKMLRYAFQNLNKLVSGAQRDEEGYLSKMVLYVQHHGFLLRFSKNLRDAYSPIMLVEYSTVAVLCFVEMYIAFKSDSIFLLSRYLIALVCALLQLSFYCIPLNYITDEAISVVQGIYDSGWDSRHTAAIKNLVPLVIQRSQKEIIFTAGGLIDMNCRTVLNVFKISYSFCTVLRALENL